MAYRRYVEKEKADIKKNKDMLSLEKEIAKMKTENVHLRKELSEKNRTDNELPATTNNGDTSIDVSCFVHLLSLVTLTKVQFSSVLCSIIYMVDGFMLERQPVTWYITVRLNLWSH